MEQQMAQRTIVQLTDDLDGTTIENGKGETVRFTFDGAEYEIDLSDKNARSMRDTLKKYTDAARRAGGATSGPRGRTRRPAAKTGGRARDYDPKQVREWAASQGIEVSQRGRVPADLVARFQEANR
jgi:hypothetical protein